MGNYTTAEHVASKLRTSFGSNTTPTASDVEDWIAEVEATINEYAGRSFTASNTATNEYHDYNGEGFLVVKNPGLLSVTSISYTTDNYATWTTLAADNYQVDTAYDTVYFRPSTSSGVHVSIPSGYRNVRITYTYGKASVPLRIQKLATDMAILEVVRSQLNSSTNTASGAISVGPISIGALSGTSITYLTNLRDSVNERLENLQQSRIRTTVGKRFD